MLFEGPKKTESRRLAALTPVDLDVNEVLFTQATIYNTFSNGGMIQTMIDDLMAGAMSVTDVPPVRVRNDCGLWYALDNRRLYCLKTARCGIVRFWDVTYTQGHQEFWNKRAGGGSGRSVRVINRA
ncbi:hypothetical protein HDU87_008558 [Geranomyces variabilis]|uniref:Uncharacterized protein n=1 Tax=Geranomyces variabilis TaxID=109894 RepID=A0AAD5TQZ8_9FUNG|nr:hypothetical protein HDU87_008558 [Geranomyces variabilis]